MIVNKLFTLLLLSILVLGCKNSDNDVDTVTTKTLFTFTSDLRHGEQWIILRDSETGDLIDAKQVVKNVPLVFESTKKVSNDKLSVTQLIISNDRSYISAGVYNEIATGSVWTDIALEVDTKAEGTPVGSYSINISNVPEIYNYALGNGVNNISYYLTSFGSNLTGEVNIGNTSRKHVVSIYPTTGNPKYQFFDNVTDNDDIFLQYSELKSYDKILNVKFPEGLVPYGDIQAIDNGYYYSLFSSINFLDQPDDLTEANFGFLNAYSNYYVRLSFGEFEYFSLGPAPASIDYVDGSQFTINNNSIDKFSATASHAYDFRSVFYLYDDPDDSGFDIDITYYDPSPGAQHHDPFTPELISTYSIPMDQVKFESASFAVGGATYEEWQKYYFGTNAPGKITLASVTKH